MDAFIVILKNVLIFVALAVPGVILAKAKMMGEKESGTLSKLLVNVGMPFLIVTSVIKIEFNAQTLTCIAISAAIGVILGVGYIALSVFLTGKGEKTKTGMERFCMVFSNNGFLGIPLAMAAFPNSPVLTSVIVINVINNLIMYIWGARMVAREPAPLSVKKIALNPLLIAFLVGVIVNLTGVQKVLPEVLTYSQHFSAIVTPLSMLIIGLKLGEIKFSKLFASAKTYYVSFVKLVLMPVITVGVLLLLRLAFDVADEIIIGAFIAFAMPTAGLASTYAKIYGGDEENAVVYTLGSTILSVATIPLLYLLLTLIL